MSSRYVEPMTLTTANTKSHADVTQVSNCIIKPSLPLASVYVPPMPTDYCGAGFGELGKPYVQIVENRLGFRA